MGLLSFGRTRTGTALTNTRISTLYKEMQFNKPGGELEKMENLSKTMLAVLAVGLLSCELFCQQAQATPSGTIDFSGFVTLSKTDSTTFKLVFEKDSVTVSSRTGLFHSIPVGTKPLFFSDLEFNTQNRELIDSNFFDFWEVTAGGVTFEYILHGEGPGNFFLTSASATLGPPTSAFAISGTGGELSGSLPNDIFNTLFKLSGTGTTPRFMFTATFIALPDGGSTIALLGIALVGLEGLRRKLRAC